jgi:hypothetical protein
VAGAVIWTDIHAIAARVCRHFGLGKVPRFEPLPHRNGEALDGRCYPGRTRLVQLRVHVRHRPRVSLRRSTIMATVVHELAHLREVNHDAAFGAFTREVAEYVRGLGQPVAHKLYGSMSRRMRVTYRRSWKDPRPRRKET